MTSPAGERAYTHEQVIELMWRFGRRISQSQYWTENFEQQIEPHYRQWAEEEITKFLANPRNR